MEDDLYEKARAAAAAEDRTLSGQIVPWVRVGQAALEHTDLPAYFIAEALTSLGEPHCDAMPFVPRTPNQHTSFSDEGAPYMAAVRFKIPDEVEDAFNAAYAGQDKNAVITELMWEAIERVERQRQRHAAIHRILDRRSRAPVRSESELAAARREGRP